eukprot:scaffold49795_cov60-Phaeocystis_antarctica.AAC.3
MHISAATTYTPGCNRRCPGCSPMCRARRGGAAHRSRKSRHLRAWSESRPSQRWSRCPCGSAISGRTASPQVSRPAASRSTADGLLRARARKREASAARLWDPAWLHGTAASSCGASARSDASSVLPPSRRTSTGRTTHTWSAAAVHAWTSARTSAAVASAAPCTKTSASRAVPQLPAGGACTPPYVPRRKARVATSCVARPAAAAAADAAAAAAASVVDAAAAVD